MNVNTVWPPSSSPSPSPSTASVIAPPRSPDIPLLSPPSAALRGRLSLHDELRSYCVRGVPGWLSVRPVDIELTQMKKGMTNQLFIAERRDSDSAAAEYSKVVVRVFGADTSTFFDREYEEYITRRLSKRGIGSRILTEFGSGRIECFLDGRTLECDDLSDPRISYLAAQALAQLHSKHIPITAALIDNAKKKVQRDARKLLPPLPLSNAAQLNVHSEKVEAESGNGSIPSPPSSPSHSLSSMSHIEHRSLPNSPIHRSIEAASLSSAIPPLQSSDPHGSSSDEVLVPGTSSVDSDDSLAYQEPLLYFRIHHWYNVARQLDFTPPADTEPLAGFSLASSAHSKYELFQSLQLSSSRVATEEQWLIGKLRSLHSLIVFCHNDLQEGNLILEANAHRHDTKARRRRRSKASTAATTRATENTANGSHSHEQPTSEQSMSSTHLDTTARPADFALTVVTHRPSSLVVDVTHRPPVSHQPARQVAVAADVSFDELQYLMHSPASPLSPESPVQPSDGSTALLRDSLDALQLDTHHQLNALLPPASPSDFSRLARSFSGSSPLSAVCSAPYSAWRLHMIDFEYSSYNPRAFDLANHVCEHYIDYSHDQWPGFVIKEQQFPSQHHIRRFITAYLHHYKKYTKDSRAVSEAELDSLYAQTMWFTLASHFKWAMWAVVQAARSEIHFGYMEYAVQRLEQYYKWKQLLIERFGV